MPSRHAKGQAQSYEFADIGISGLTRYGPVSRVYEEFLRELQGPQGMKNYREFSENDPIAGAIIFACQNLAKSVTFRFDAVDSSQEAQAAAEFVKGAIIDDMGQTWPDTLTEIMSMLPFGWALFEWRLKRRLGQEPPRRTGGQSEADRVQAVVDQPYASTSASLGPTGQGVPEDDFAPSKFNDGKIGFRDWSLRSQETLFMWEFNENSTATVMQQMAPPDYRLRRIPMPKALLFRTRLNKNNPEGYSVLRNGWTSYYFKKKIQVFEAIGVERDLAGYPVIQLKQMVSRIRRDEQEGAVMPPWAKLVLASSGGARRQFDTNQIITRYDQRIAQSVLFDLIMLGHDAVGSKALASTKSSLFSQALTGFLDNVCAVINRFAVPVLLRANGIPQRLAPTMTKGDVETIDLADLGAYVKNLSGSGMSLFPNHDLEEALLHAAKLPTAGITDSPTDNLGYDPGGFESNPLGDGDVVDDPTTPGGPPRPRAALPRRASADSLDKRRRAFRAAMRAAQTAA
jgi:hypothetical protein